MKTMSKYPCKMMIGLSEDGKAWLIKKSAQTGMSMAAYVRFLVNRDIGGANGN